VSPRRVLIYGINYAPEIAGVGRYTGEIGEHLVALGCEVHVVTAPPHYPGWAAQHGHSPRRWTRESLAGAMVHRCPLYLHPKMSGVRRLFAPLSFALSSAPVALWQILRRRPDVVLVVEPALFAAPAGLIAARLVGAKTVLHVQDLEVEAAFAVGHLGKAGAAERLATLFDRTVTRAFDRVVTISNRMAKRIAAKGVAPHRIAVVRNWVDLKRIRPLDGPSPYRAELGLPANAFVALYAGNLGVKQGVRVLVEAARALADRPEVVFVVAGEGPMRPALEEAAAGLPNLRLLPFQPEARMRDFLGLADVHLLPQERDAADLLLPSKLGGMLASGRPIVATAEAGTELAGFLGPAAVLTPPGDAAALAEAITALAAAADPHAGQALRLERAARLSKTEALDAFARAALFLHETPDRAPVAEAAE
jgi:colanic acid biosynthesis glycosyl transferase WcaI